LDILTSGTGCVRGFGKERGGNDDVGGDDGSGRRRGGRRALGEVYKGDGEFEKK
jgi:hypothetical protein